ncbi:MAG: sugar nucleotide-binding protein [Chitinophagales bacterium]|nr:sugar nucleotide-binding protein [Chitinophagales bacterium]
MKKILITGANGFVAKNLIKKLHNQNIKVLPLSRNPIRGGVICNFLDDSVTSVLKNYSFDAIII